jgi:L-threonylcarbamoyladenylate synthase
MAEILTPSEENISRAATALRAGSLVAFPTETVYGLGANALDASAVGAIYAAKGRPSTNPLIVHLAESDEIFQVAQIAAHSAMEQAIQKLRPLWPGPLSLILPRSSTITPAVSAGLPTIAVRVPAHPVARELISRAGVPVAAPSANISTYVSPTSAQHVATGLGDKISFIIDGGPCEIGIESTILSLVHPSPTVLRHGSITLEELREILGQVDDGTTTARETEALLSPGLLKQHYSPHTRLVFEGEADPATYPPRVALISFSPRREENTTLFLVVRSLSPTGELAEAARTLFATLRELDAEGFDLLVVEPCARTGLGRALMDRLSRAAARNDALGR